MRERIDRREIARNVSAGGENKFVRPPSQGSYGTVAVFQDLYGNQWDMLQLKAKS